ncbi:putative nuclease HARBI1 [Cimex lectularius]|uniref:Putative nuclease HARBI1 n=1 Tax=Cimex lectularius TaxID=79782 RepID=A0A8I6SSE6_CIMLE|nr:putative nuclease HARBI1 [Cimex lectularius]
MTKNAVNFVLEKIRNSITHRTTRNQATAPELMLQTTLRFYATGSFLTVCGDFSGLHKSTVCRMVRRVSRALASLRREFIHFPKNEAGRMAVCAEMYKISKFPKCIGAIDCTHVRLQSPGGNQAELFRNTKGFFSLNVQTVCDAELKFENIVARWPGSTHDAHIFRNSVLKTQCENGDMKDLVLVGDSGYPLKKCLLTKLNHPTTREEILYNESLIRTRNVVERSYGVWKRRFPILAIGMRCNFNLVEPIVVATAVLHNISCIFKDPIPFINDEVETQIINLQFNQIGEVEYDGNARIPFIEYFDTL